MLYNFRINVISRVAFLIVLIFGLTYSYLTASYPSTILLGLILVGLVGNLVYYINQTNRDLGNFFNSLAYNDFTTNTSGGHKGKSFRELHQQLNLINSKFQEIRADKEANHQFLSTIVEHVDIGLLCLNNQEEVIFMNKALQKLLHKSYLIDLNGLQKVNEELWEMVKELPHGERKLLKININNKLLQLAVQAIEFNMQKATYRLISFQNIKNELEEQELLAWQKLIRILTHEIMNSVAPIASLSSTISTIIEKGVIDQDQQEMIQNGVAVIQRRSEGLLNFTETYRRLTRIPPPRFQLTDIKELIEDVATLFKVDLQEKGILLHLNLPLVPLQIQGDPDLLEQVLINIVKNAIEAVEEIEEGKIGIRAEREADGKVNIIIADNGYGIPEEQLEQIFVPFFTTKEEGSGIGLSLSRQILRLHNGDIEIQSTIGEQSGTVVRLTL